MFWREKEVVRDPLRWADLQRFCVEGLEKASWIVDIVENEIAIGEDEAIQEKWRGGNQAIGKELDLQQRRVVELYVEKGQWHEGWGLVTKG